jgi:MFS family permease
MGLAGRIGANKAVLALSFARLGDALGNSILFIVLPLYVAVLPAPWLPLPESVRAGILISVFGLVNALLQPFAAAFSDWLDRRKAFVQAGLLVMGLSTLGLAAATRFSDLLLLRIAQGIGLGVTLPASMALLAHASSQGTRGGTMGVYTTLRMTGLTLGPLIGGALYDRYGFTPAFFVGAGFIALAVVLVQWWVKDVRTNGDGRPRAPLRFMERRLLSPGIVGAGFATFVMASAFSMMTPLEQQFNERLHQGAFAFAVAFSVLMVSRLLLQVPLGWLSDRVGRKPLIIGGLLVMAPATALLGFVHTTGQLVALRVIQGAGSAGVAAPAFALAADLATAGGTGRQMSVLTMGFGLGIATGPLLGGLLAVPSFELPFLVAALMLVVCAWFIARRVPETLHRNATS